MTDRLREGIGRLLGEEWPSADVLDMLERDAEDRRQICESLNGDPLAIEVAMKCGVLRDGEPPQEQRDPRSAREIAASLMRTPIEPAEPGEPIAPEPPDALMDAVTARLRHKDNSGASNLGLLPRQSKEQ